MVVPTLLLLRGAAFPSHLTGGAALGGAGEWLRLKLSLQTCPVSSKIHLSIKQFAQRKEEKATKPEEGKAAPHQSHNPKREKDESNNTQEEEGAGPLYLTPPNELFQYFTFIKISKMIKKLSIFVFKLDLVRAS